MTKIEKLLPRSLFAICLNTATLTTLIVLPSVYDPFNSPKMWTLMLGSSWMIGWITSYFRSTDREILGKFQKYIYLGYLFFLISLIICFLFSQNRYTAFFGDLQRRNGLVSYICLLVLGFMAYLTFPNYNKTKFHTTLLMLGLAESIYGIFQHNGIDFVKWNNPYNSVIGTLGNPNFSSAVFAILSVLLFGSSFNPGLGKVRKLFSFLASLLLVYAILASNARQGFLSLLFGYLIFFTFYSKYSNNGLYFGLKFLSPLLVLIAGLGVLNKGPLAPIIYKSTIEIRNYYWRAGIKMLENFPITGVGLDNYGSYFKQFRDPLYAYSYGFQITSTNAHNTIIQLFATGGLLLGISYLMIQVAIVFSFFKFWRGMEKSPDSILLLTLFSSWCAFQAQSLVSIDNLGISVWGWLLGGCLLSFANSATVKDKGLVSKKSMNKVTYFPSGSQFFTSGLLTLISFLLVSFLFQSETNVLKIRNWQVNDLSSKQALVKAIDSSFNSAITEPGLKVQLAIAMNSLQNIEKSNQMFDKIIRENPRNLDAFNSRASLFESKSEFLKAIEDRKKIQQLDPFNLQNINLLAQNYLRIGDKLTAKTLFEFVASTDVNQPEVQQARKILEELKN